MSAKVSIKPFPDVPHTRVVTVDCEHSTTSIYVMTPPGTPKITDHEAILMVIDRGQAETPCRCLTRIRRRYAVNVN
jgi:hypothetical protein